MSNIILKIENLSKQYRLGLVGTGTMGDDLKRWWYKIRGKEDPFLKIGDINNRATKGTSDYVWALKDINFEVQQGEVLGIIGKNGAGKSTLLKILSKITSPTTGSIKSKGRVASLLEVGTGFHEEMTGRENIFLNGAILGMTKKEITDKLEEIIEFSGCERYIDTPVKRYSSGMTVRLAFAVAAFLEPDILIIDEVLAVGDAEFQKKAIGKMQEISKGGGRTVLFVSHNMSAVQSLCTRGMVLENGGIVFDGLTENSIEYYTSLCRNDININNEIHSNNTKSLIINKINITKSGKSIQKNESVLLGETIEVLLEIKILDEIRDLSFAINVLNDKFELITHMINEDCGIYFSKVVDGQILKLKITTDKILFIPGLYTMDLWIGVGQMQTLYTVKNFFWFTLEQSDYTMRTKALPKHSKFYLHTKWELI